MSDKRETGWLIENAGGLAPAYWDGRGWNTFHYNPNEAVRFARKEDADRVKVWICQNSALLSTEHAWLSTAPLSADQPSSTPPARSA